MKKLLLIILVMCSLPRFVFGQISKEWDLDQKTEENCNSLPLSLNNHNGQVVFLKGKSNDGIIVQIRTLNGSLLQEFPPIPNTVGDFNIVSKSWFANDQLALVVGHRYENKITKRLIIYRGSSLFLDYPLPEAENKFEYFSYDNVAIRNNKVLIAGGATSTSGWTNPLYFLLDLTTMNPVIKYERPLTPNNSRVERILPAPEGWYVTEKTVTEIDEFNSEHTVKVCLLGDDLNYYRKDSITFKFWLTGEVNAVPFYLQNGNGIGVCLEEYSGSGGGDFTRFHALTFNQSGRINFSSSPKFKRGIFSLRYGHCIDLNDRLVVVAEYDYQGFLVSFDADMDTLSTSLIKKEAKVLDLVRGLDGGYCCVLKYSTASGLGYNFSYFSITPGMPKVLQFTDNQNNVSASVTSSINGGSPITGYGVEYRLKNSTNDWAIVESASADLTVSTASNSDYEFRFFLRNKNGKSLYSKLYVTSRMSPAASSPDYSAVVKLHEDNQPTPTGIADNPKVKITLYPNPSSGPLTIETEYSGSIIITDIQGKLVLINDLYPGKSEINISAGSGIYFYTITTDEGSTSGKIIVRQ